MYALYAQNGDEIICLVIRGGSTICGEKGGGGGAAATASEGFWRVPFEDPLWNFKRDGRAPPAPPPPPNPLVVITKEFGGTQKKDRYNWVRLY